ncbi:hypothetical protein [Ancylomarina sp. 16SWW S1-10-2]|uniref:hypothetical protein n=1 Tax=Ancylomarina sp. 16SWW S1-10-2 TaxID=2499681 RepID=UPI0012ADB66A|nr:hypothetical protein [Ancylomarina sp. 16SWW S1-10-2]MRT92743.1 hypothetical protein [Ancylomarina sp. 16SWW S1-10-2]
MKKLILTLVVCLSVLGAFAQDAVKLKNDGNAALKAKDYKSAIVHLENYLRTPEASEDIKTVYNVGYAAYKVKDYAKSVIYFDKAIAAKYKLSSSYLRKATSQKKLKKYDDMVATLKAGIAAVPAKNAKLAKTLAKHYLLTGQAAQKASKFEEAENLYKEASEVKSSMKTDAIVSLGSLYFGEGAKIQAAANPFANTDKDKFASEIAKAKSFYTKAAAQYTKAKTLSPAREDIDSLLTKVKDVLK